MKKISKPWGFEIIWAKTENYVGKLLHINPKQRLSLQLHQEKEETVYVIQGNLLNYIDSKSQPQIIPKGQSFHVRPNQIHRFGAGPEAVEIIEVSTPHLDDVVRIEDDYDR